MRTSPASSGWRTRCSRRASSDTDSGVVAGGKGFNGEAKGDIEKYEGEAAEGTPERLRRGERLSDRELTELERTFRDNGDDPAFSRTLLDGLGAEGTVRLTNELNDLVRVRGGDRVGHYAKVETGLAHALASATQDTGSPRRGLVRGDAGGRPAGVDPSDENARYVEHTERNETVLRSALTHLAERGDDFPASLREPMAKILVNHGDTVHRSMNDVDVAASPFDRTDLFEVTKQISKAQDAYGTLNAGLNQAMVSGIHGADSSDSEESLTRAGRTVGFLAEARVQAQGDPKVAEFGAKPLLDAAISYIPVVSDKIQQGVDCVTEKWLEDEQRKLDEQMTEESVARYEDRNKQLIALAEEWQEVHERGKDSEYGRPTKSIRRRSPESPVPGASPEPEQRDEPLLPGRCPRSTGNSDAGPWRLAASRWEGRA